jgi:Ca2+-binding RTX toxin-like protein
MLALPGAAHAGTAGVDQIEGDDIVFSGDPGEANRLTLTGQGGGTVVLEDAAHPITPGRGCTAVAPNRVSCTNATFVIVELEDGDDEVTTAGDLGQTPVFLDGDQGSDVIHGEVGRTHLDGGVGTDRLFGGVESQSIDGVDLVRRGEFGAMPDHNRERDELACAGPPALGITVDANDAVTGPCGQRAVYLESFVLVEGTEGPDNLSARGEPTRVFGLGGDDGIFGVDTDDRADGGAGDDRIFGQGLLLGGPGGDRLDAGSSVRARTRPRLDGQSGADQVVGSAGADSLAGGSGADAISGRDGNDTIRVRDGVRDRVRCGPGRDSVSADRRDGVASDCERVSRG